VTVDVCGTSVPDVWVVLDVVLAAALVDVVPADVVDVVEDELEVGLLEQAASAKAQAGRSNRLIERFRKAVGTLQLTTAASGNGGCARSVVQPEGDDARTQTRVGAVPITEARSMERRWGQ
jgi:hypothetical protein